MILYNVLIFTFGFWNIFKKNKSLSPILGLGFMASLGYAVFSLLNSSNPADDKVYQGLAILFGLSILGYILIALSNNKIAQVGAVVMAAVGVNLYISNPHTPIDPNIKLDNTAEILLRIDHDNKTFITNEIQSLSFVISTEPILTPKDASSTKLDDYYQVNISDNYDLNHAISDISQVDGVEWIEPNEMMEVEFRESQPIDKAVDFIKSVNDPLANSQWNMDALNMGEYYDLFQKSKYAPKRTAKLFILDSGVNADHEDIYSNFARHKSNDRSANESDKHGHGTHCAGVASAISNNSKGIASMSPGPEYVTVSSVKVMNNFGFGTQTRIIEGIIEAVDAGADVISMSLGGRSNQIEEESYHAALQYAEDHNVIVVAAAGNNAGDASLIVPANSKTVITVTALDRNLNKAQFSNYITNTNYGIAAPGTSIMSTYKNGKYGALDGTSMAAPHVSGLIAVMKSLNPSLKTKDAFKILDKTGSNTNDNRLTGKMINPKAAIQATLK